MREILFRGKSRGSGKWIYGNLAYYPDVNRAFIRPNAFKGTIYAEEVDRKTVGQYTGLRDKNGERIFEGDVMRFVIENQDKDLMGHYVAKWNTDGGGIMANYYVKGKLVDSDVFEKRISTMVEIIGNITDNQDLIEGER